MNNTAVLYDHYQLLMCNVNVKNTTVNVTAATGKLEAEPIQQGDAKWHDWEVPEQTMDPLLYIVRWKTCFLGTLSLKLQSLDQLYPTRCSGKRPALLHMDSQYQSFDY